jgi:hypothetical protein
LIQYFLSNIYFRHVNENNKHFDLILNTSEMNILNNYITKPMNILNCYVTKVETIVNFFQMHVNMNMQYNDASTNRDMWFRPNDKMC